MNIAIDFDDVIVDTISEFIGLWNRRKSIWAPSYLTRNAITNWHLPSILKVPDERIRELFDAIDYDRAAFMSGAVEGILKLKDDGHFVTVLTANKRYRDIRDALNSAGLQSVNLAHGVGNKAGYCRDNDIDVLVEDRPSYLKGAVTVCVHAIRFVQPWNRFAFATHGNSEYAHTAGSWGMVLEIIGNLAKKKLVAEIASLTLQSEAQVIKVAKQSVEDEVITNANGAKQSKINGRFDLLPSLAVKEVAMVLAEGEAKYGKDNWKGLSIDEINNHVYNHLLDYQQEPNLEDLSHAATRILMALQLHIERLDKQGPLGA